MIPIIIKALFSRLLSAARSAFDLARANPHLAIIIALVGVCGLLWWSRGNIRDERDALRAHAAEVVDASKRLLAANERFSKASKEIAHEADSKDTDLRIVYRDRVMRIPSAGGQCATPPDRVPEGASGPGGDSINIPRSDALICATNTSRLLAGHEWAVTHQDLQDNGMPGIY
jgi:hypothetical protein